MCFTSFTFSSLIMLLLMITVLSFKAANCIECFDCASVSNISECNQTNACPEDHYCFTYKSESGDQTMFSLGCRSTQDCLSSLTATSDDIECSQCCAVDSCNANLCTGDKHVVNTSVCEDNPDYNCHSTFNVCSDINHADRVCRKFCGICKIVHGGWSMWSSWGSCSVTCGIGVKIRDRSCSNPSPGPGGDQCNGDRQDDRLCFGPCAVVDGHWSSWTNWEICPVNCGVGTKTRTRTCTNPSPSGSGKACSGNSEDKDVCNTQSCSSDVRLVDGAYVYEGRLEVYHNGVWGTVCDDYFNETSATVVCNMLHYRGNTPRVYSGAHFGAGTLPILLDDVVCTGTETSLFSCQHNELGSHNCGHGEDVGISCIPNLNVRLVDGSSSQQGRVEVSVDGSNWGTVCDDDFSDNSAKVVCRMLGYSTSNARADESVSAGTGHIYLDDVKCTGTEGSLTYCKHRDWGKHNCGHGEDVGVICS